MLKLTDKFSISRLNKFLKSVNIDTVNWTKNLKSTESWWAVEDEYSILALGCVDLKSKEKKIYVVPILKSMCFETLLFQWFDLILWDRGIK